MAEEADGEMVVPPTLQALLAARLDQLDPGERSVLERGAIEGEVFHRGAVQALAPEETQVTPRLAALVRKELIRPDRAQLAGEDGFRFRHLLIRDAAYEALPKAMRADLHQRFATWLEQHGAELVELDEIVGYHLEQAYRYRTSSDAADDPQLAAAARRRLTAGGHRAQLRADYGAAVSLLRARRRPRADGRDRPRARSRARRVLVWAGRGDDALRARNHSPSGPWRPAIGSASCAGGCSAGVAPHIPRAGGRDREAGRAHRGGVARVPGRRRRRGAVHRHTPRSGRSANMRGQVDAALEAYEQAAVHARRAGLPHEDLGWRATLRFTARRPCRNCWPGWTRTSHEQDGTIGSVRTGPRRWRCSVASTRRARSWPKPGRSFAERGSGIPLATTSASTPSRSSYWAGDPAAAAEFGAEGCRLFEELGEHEHPVDRGRNARAGALRARPARRGRRWASRAAELGASDDAITQMLWRQVRAKVLARRGESDEAERLAREAVGVAEATDFLDPQGDVYADLAEVLLLGGRPEEAISRAQPGTRPT